MTHIITSLCLRDAGCVDVCPVECIVPGKPADQWPWYYIDPDTCIDCGACVPECPFAAIFPEADVPAGFTAKAGQRVSMPAGTAGFDAPYEGENHKNESVHLDHTRLLQAGETLDLTADIKPNYEYFKSGPGYKALES
ncbi:MAG: ferredoxin family protein [Anaerolineales bacterium]|nr:ferredoxin family protein [Anaerolineales bacterium]